MAAPNRPEPETGTALAITAEERNALTQQQLAAIAERKNQNLVIAKIASTNWGRGMDVETRRAVADWGQRNGVDVTTEIHVLGGNIYLNHQFYINRLTELAQRGEVLDHGYSFINVDSRLKPDVDAEEIERRRQARIFHNADEKATAIVVYHVVFTRNPHTRLEGCKWTPRWPDKAEKDPIGVQYPQETAISRAARRCLKFAIPQLSPRLRAAIQSVEDDAVITVGEVLERAHEQMKLDEKNRVKEIRGVPIQDPTGTDAYTESGTAAQRQLTAGPADAVPPPAETREPVTEHVAAPARKDREPKREPTKAAAAEPARAPAQRAARATKADPDDQAAIDLDDKRLEAEERERTDSLVRDNGHELEAEDI